MLISIKTFAALTALACIALLSGCGGDDGSTDTAGTSSPTTASTASESASSAKEGSTLSPADSQFAKQASALCTLSKNRLVKELSAYQKQHGASDVEHLDHHAVETVLLPAIESQIEELRELSSPTAEKRLQEYLDTMQQAIGTIENRDLTTIRDIARVFRLARDPAQKSGIIACAYG